MSATTILRAKRVTRWVLITSEASNKVPVRPSKTGKPEIPCAGFQAKSHVPWLLQNRVLIFPGQLPRNKPSAGSCLAIGKKTEHAIKHALLCRRRPIFPGSCPPSIFGAVELNYRVRDGNGWDLNAIDTDFTHKVFPECSYILAQRFRFVKSFFYFLKTFFRSKTGTISAPA